MFIVVGVTGGIAAYKAVQLVRLLVLDGHDVHVIPTEDALRFVGLPTWQALSRNQVTTSVHDDVERVRHVALADRADLVVVAPATANTLAKMTAGIADNLLCTTLLATRAPVIVAPAMHTEMWRHPATRANVDTLRRRGVQFVGPDVGALTGGDVGPGRLSEPEEIHRAVRARLGARQDLAGVHLCVSAGGTHEPIDPVRFIGNRSSGRQGVAVACDAARRGASVTLVACNVADHVLEPALQAELTVVRAGTAAELATVMHRLAPAQDVVVMAAAVADYCVAEVSSTKLTKEEHPEPPTLTLVQNEDVLASLAEHRRPGQIVVGFAAETARDEDDLVARGRAKRRRKGCDLIAANAVGWDRGFERAENAIVVIGPDDEVLARSEGTKDDTARALVDAIVALRARA
ncbi:bifunctional phosphopantothenoylcysteine decarboxylase/phosphopantothenate--cysteine ligase CoaBC [uncultured Tessaracoccus sp.]|uniref:bifunctional phosphopantothenoylcysteine decarboxylase/phosphopantothenate--cysteine ligase CoaBC n=1 Tax=uncultured Tessaracoccus sp. TaxID=905023 RepID=UPI0025E4E1C5|nr:bifunctional phosphopantothenoylcysteine decarboxylase/phosphopantothenate--cysteine ligase CoaBC [uncultured Tessaracoccus sp.]